MVEFVRIRDALLQLNIDSYNRQESQSLTKTIRIRTSCPKYFRDGFLYTKIKNKLIHDFSIIIRMKFKKWSIIIGILLLILSSIPYLNFLSPFIITYPIFGRVTDAITGDPIPNISAVMILDVEVFCLNGACDDREVSRNLIYTNKNGRFFVPPKFAFKMPPFEIAHNQKIYINENPQYYPNSNYDRYSKSYMEEKKFYPRLFIKNHFFWQRSKTFHKPFLRNTHFKLMPKIANPDLCENAKDDFVITWCKKGKIGVILNNTPEICDNLYYGETTPGGFFRASERHDECKTVVEEIYQDIEKNDDCKNWPNSKGKYIFNHACVVAKAIAFEDPDICLENYGDTKFFKSLSQQNAFFGYYYEEDTENPLAYPTWKRNFAKLDYRDFCLMMVAYRSGNNETCNSVGFQDGQNLCHYLVNQK